MKKGRVCGSEDAAGNPHFLPPSPLEKERVPHPNPNRSTGLRTPQYRPGIRGRPAGWGGVGNADEPERPTQLPTTITLTSTPTLLIAITVIVVMASASATTSESSTTTTDWTSTAAPYAGPTTTTSTTTSTSTLAAATLDGTSIADPAAGPATTVRRTGPGGVQAQSAGDVPRVGGDGPPDAPCATPDTVRAAPLPRPGLEDGGGGSGGGGSPGQDVSDKNGARH